MIHGGAGTLDHMTSLSAHKNALITTLLNRYSQSFATPYCAAN